MDYHELQARYAVASDELQRRLAASTAAVTAMTRAGEAETAAMRDLYAVLPTFMVTGSPRTPHGAVQVVLWEVLDDGDVIVHYLAGERMIALLHKNAEGTAYVQGASVWRTLINEGHPAQITAPVDVVEGAIRELRALQASARPVELARAARRRADAQCEAAQRQLTECKDALAAASQADQAAKLQWYATNQDYVRLHPMARVLVTQSDMSAGCTMVRVTGVGEGGCLITSGRIPGTLHRTAPDGPWTATGAQGHQYTITAEEGERVVQELHALYGTTGEALVGTGAP